MKRKIGILFIFIMLISVSILGQTAKELEKAFGAQAIYEIRPKVLMRAKFNNSGEICKVTFQPNNYSAKTNTVFFGESGLDIVQLKEAFEEIVPKSQRSGQIKPPPVGYDISGGFFSGMMKTEDININLSGIWRDKDSQTIDFCDLFGTDKSEMKKFSFCTMHGVLGLLTVEWPKRGCE